MKITKKSICITSIFLILSLLLSSCFPSVTYHSSTGQITADEIQEREAFQNFLLTEFQNSFEDDGLSLHYALKNPESYNIEKPVKALPSITEDYNEKCKTSLLETQSALKAINSSYLDEKQKITYDTLERYLNQQLSLCEYPQFLHVLSATTGISSNLPLTLAEYTFYSEEDVKDYLNILTQVPTILEESMIWEENMAKNGYSLCDFEIDDIIGQIDRFLQPAESHLLTDTFNERIDALSDLSTEQKDAYIQNNLQLVTSTVIPAFEAIKEDLSNLKANAPSGLGLSNYEDGKEYYELLIQSMTMSDRSMDTLIKSLEKRMNNIVKRITDVTMQSPDVYDIYCNTQTYLEETPEEMLSKLQEYITDNYPALSNVTYTVEPIPDALKNNSTAAYYMIPPYDSATENRIFYGNSYTNSASLFMLLAHEGYPGHLYQQNYLLQNDLSPIYYVMDITGYKEGWAYYVQINAANYCDFGDYDDNYHDALTELYRCNDEFSYCISSLIDIYVNYKSYDKEAVGRVLTKYGLDSTSAKAFYEYAVEEPGTYLQYYIGYLELLSIRQEQEKSLGNNFNEKEFHTELLNIGPCYYETLEKTIKNQ